VQAEIERLMKILAQGKESYDKTMRDLEKFILLEKTVPKAPSELEP
jgi:hypothetical protein